MAGEKRRSLERKLPLLMTSVIASTLVISLLLTYATLKQQSRQATLGRLRGAGAQLASIAQTGVAQLRTRILGVSRDTAVVSAVTAVLEGKAKTNAALSASAQRAMERAFTPADSNVVTELWTVDGRRVGAVTRGTPPQLASPNHAPEVAPPTSWYEGLDPLARKDSIALGRFYTSGGRTYYWVVSDVRSGGRRIGYLLKQQRINGQTRAVETLRALMGSRVSAYYHNATGDGWTNLRARPVSAPVAVRADNDANIVARPDAGEFFAREDSIPGSPWHLTLELPAADPLVAPRAAIFKILLISALLTLVGAAASWLISRRITRPLVSLTAAAEAVAHGDFGARVKTTSDDELGRLGEAFNRMAADVGASREDLATQTEEAQATAKELEHREAELRIVAAEAEKANRAKSEFLTVMSHELRTPLNAIAGYAELLLLEIRGPLTDAQRRDLERIRASQQHLLGLISSVLDLSRIESGRVSYDVTPIALDAFLTGLDSLIEPQAASKSLTLEYTPCARSLGVMADREKLRQIMLNLLSNAIRYTPPGGKISVGARATSDSQVEITVRDTGVGIAPEARDRVFEAFVQLDRSLTQPREGIGLGLAISRDLARGMSGDITVESNSGQGSLFTVTMPRVVLEGDDGTSTSGEVAAARPAARSA